MAQETVRLAQAETAPQAETQAEPGTPAPETQAETTEAPATPGTTAADEAALGAAEVQAADAPRIAEDTEAQEVVPGAPVEEPLIQPIPQWGLFAGAGVAVLLVAFFVWALVRARRRRRQELAEEPTEETPSGLTEGGPVERPVPPPPPEAAPPPTPVVPEGDKARRREAFLEEQRRIREEKEREEAAAAAAEAEARALAEAEAQRAREEEERRREALLAPSGSLTQSLARTRGGFMARLNAVLGKEMDESALEELEEVLFTADIGVQTASRLLQTVRESLSRRQAGDAAAVREAVRDRIVEVLKADGTSTEGEGIDPSKAPGRPYVLMVVGVNGVGKTTTIGKLAGRLVARGHKVVLAAGDTFRAAAVEQLEVWGDRVGAEVVKREEGADPGSVVFDAVTHAQEVGADVVICDTAGRLHTKVPLMEELRKVHRVLGKARAGAPDDVLLVVDATTGQNAIQQAKLFSEAVPLTGIALTKLDGTAKGGVVIGISDEMNIPVRYIGVGEKVGDLRPFEPRAFVEALFG